MAIAAAILVGGGARAETDGEYLHPGAPRKSPSPYDGTASQPAPPKQRAPNPAMCAPAAAANNKRMSDQQRDEWRFLKDATAAGRFETEASRLALAKSGNAGIRSFATTVINHNASVSNELVHMLHVRGMAPPMLANHQRKILNRLAKLRGAKFDRYFMEEVGLKSQRQDVQIFERARLVAQDPQLQAWIERMLPTLRHHLTMAERLAPRDTKLLRGAPAVSAEPARVSLRDMTSAPRTR